MNNNQKIIYIFYGIGALIAIIGVSILLGQNWEQIGFIARVFVTLGISFITYTLGLILKSPEHRILSEVMYIVTAFLASLGSYVLLRELHLEFSWLVQLYTAALIFLAFLIAQLITKRNVLVLLLICFGTWIYYLLVVKVLSFNYFNNDLVYIVHLILGTSYIFIGHGLASLWKLEWRTDSNSSKNLQASDPADDTEKKIIQHILYALGTLVVLVTGISIGGIFDLIMIALIFGTFYGSIYLKSRLMLILGMLFLMIHLIKLTSEYFVDSIGWPVALILIGFCVIAVGFMTFRLNQKFFLPKE